MPGPWFIPDEVVYAQLGRSLWSSGHFRILGATPDFFGLVYPAFAGLPLHAAGIARGYHLLKWLQALAMSLAAVPVYLWGRMLVSEGWAVAAAALTLLVPELGLSSFLLTEVLFYPVFCLTAWLMARALLLPTLARQALVLGAIFLAAMTRLQAIFLAPAFVLAGLLYFGPRGVRRLLPSLAALALVAAGWIGLTLANGGHVLGAYQVTSSGYRPFEALRFVAYHAADLVLASGVVPAVALVALCVSALRARERSREVRAFLAVTVSLVLAVVPVVGVYASEWTGRLAERNLIVLVPLLFLALAVWLTRRETRWSLDALVGCAFVAALLLVTPWGRFVVPAAEPDALSLVPLVQLRDHLAPYVAVVLVAAALIAVLLALPRRLLSLVPMALGVLLVAASVSAARVSAKQARGYELTMAGSDKRWIDKHAPGPVLLLYGGELGWSGGGPVWTSLFWNARVEQVDELFGSRVVGPIPPSRALVDGDGRVVVPGDARDPVRYVVAPRRLQLAGVPLWGSTSQLLWQVDVPLRIRTRSGGIDPGSRLLSDPARLDVYDCTGVTVAVGLTAPDDRVVRLLRNGTPYRSVRLVANTPWRRTVPLVQRRRVCTLTIRGAAGARLDRLDAG